MCVVSYLDIYLRYFLNVQEQLYLELNGWMNVAYRICTRSHVHILLSPVLCLVYIANLLHFFLT